MTIYYSLYYMVTIVIVIDIMTDISLLTTIDIVLSSVSLSGPGRQAKFRDPCGFRETQTIVSGAADDDGRSGLRPSSAASLRQRSHARHAECSP